MGWKRTKELASMDEDRREFCIRKILDNTDARGVCREGIVKSILEREHQREHLIAFMEQNSFSHDFSQSDPPKPKPPKRKDIRVKRIIRHD